jgi:outer membrane lipoprotein
MKIRAFMPLIFIAMLSACASGIPRPISEPPPVKTSVAEARTDIERLRGTQVRWGGKIAGVENHPTETWIDIVELPLSRYGRPQETDRSGGRFIARIEGFLDPHVYTSGRQITVAGTLEKTLSRAIGDYPYTYPVVKTEVHHLWSPLEDMPPRYYYDPYWYDPWYPWGYPPYPYYHPRFYR